MMDNQGSARDKLIQRKRAAIEEFFQRSGIPVVIEEQRIGIVVTMDTLVFNERKAEIERWYEVLRQDPEKTSLRERPRGLTERAPRL